MEWIIIALVLFYLLSPVGDRGRRRTRRRL